VGEESRMQFCRFHRGAMRARVHSSTIDHHPKRRPGTRSKSGKPNLSAYLFTVSETSSRRATAPTGITSRLHRHTGGGSSSTWRRRLTASSPGRRGSIRMPHIIAARSWFLSRACKSSPSRRRRGRSSSVRTIPPLGQRSLVRVIAPRHPLPSDLTPSKRGGDDRLTTEPE
jgi:hypothetical protein